jgi:hypothetical protein
MNEWAVAIVAFLRLLASQVGPQRSGHQNRSPKLAHCFARHACIAGAIIGTILVMVTIVRANGPALCSR